jgi:hypothetical protein
MRRERKDHTLQATALVHEAYLKLTEQRSIDWQGRAHFFCDSSSSDAPNPCRPRSRTLACQTRWWNDSRTFR